MEDPQNGEGDETISLSDVLVARDSCLPEDELWALCRECCLVLEVVNNSPDMFQTLCVTPDTVAFDQVGNVCFLDLDVDPEQIYIPPEYANEGNSCKAHLYSLGMTLLYAAEYNGDDTKNTTSTELRDLLGHMTADNYNSRPDLESVIILCEEQLCGQSSQEVCSCIPAATGFGVPLEAKYIDIETSYLEDDASFSPEDFSYLESLQHSETGDTTYCDDIPDTAEDVSKAEDVSNTESLGAAESLATSELGEATTEPVDDLPLDSDTDVDKLVQKKTEAQTVNSKQGSNQNSNSKVSESDPISKTEKDETNTVKPVKPTLPPKPRLNATTESNVSVTDIQSAKIPKAAPSNVDNQVSVSLKWEDLRRDSVKIKEKDSKDGVENGFHVPKESSIVSDSVISVVERSDMSNTTAKSAVDVPMAMASNSDVPKGCRNKRKQGVTITEVLDTLLRPLEEQELWALCKEGTAALQRKKKHLPAYLSPDTLLIRESGNVSFKAIPEEKPLEVIFMAPELQTKGELSEKTCLFGLSVTLRCAAGKKYASVSAMNVSQQMKDLLHYLADSNPVKRPELADIAKICVEQSNGTASETVCRKIYLETIKRMAENEEKENQSKAGERQKLEKPSAFKPIPGSTFQPIKPAASVGIEPVKPSPIGSSGAFCPIPKKKKEESMEPRIPSAFSSPATHFKPIILQQDLPTTNEKTPKQSTPEKKSTPQKMSSPDQPSDKDKEVVRKLKELKKNLMKHRQPNLAKDLENEDKGDSEQDKSPTKSSSSKSSTPSKRSSIPSRKSSTSKSEGRERSKKHSSRNNNVSGEALDSLLKEIQKQGAVPDTQSLATAIAQYLQGHLSQKSDQKTKTELDMSVTSGHQSVHSQGQGQFQGPAGLGQGLGVPGYDLSGQLPNLNIPYHSQLVGQTMTLPMQYGGGGVFAGYPQVQLQHDPVTGYLQLVPVMPIRPSSSHSHAGSTHGSLHNASPMGSGSAGKDSLRSPLISPQFSPGKTNQNDPHHGAISNESDINTNKPKSSHGGRTARDLVHKTANLRAKNLGLPPSSNLLSVPDQGRGLHKWKSDHALDKSLAVSDHCFSDGEAVKHSAEPRGRTYVYDDTVLHLNRNNPYLVSQFASGEGLHRHRTHSNSSSPSPSKDSGVSGMNLGYKTSEASLMDRLLSNVNVKQQKILGTIVHLLREEFAFDGYMENGVEDLAMAEYIASLGVLKWDTFTSAISEKYSDLYWGADLLASLYQAVNGERPRLSTQRQHREIKRNIPLQASHPRRSAVDDDVDSSSLSESNDYRRRRQENKHTSELPPPVANSVQPKPDGAHADTSDSTDNENYGKRRRFKTKHELDKTKSNSTNNLLLDLSVNAENQSVETSKSPLVQIKPESSVVNGLQQSQQSPKDANSRQSFSVNHSSPTSPQISNTSPSHTSLQHTSSRTSSSTVQNSKPVSVKHAPTLENGQSNSSVSSIARSPGSDGLMPANARLSQISLSSQSSSQSDLNRDIKMADGTAMAMVQKKGHVVYHWAMIHLSMTQEVETFMQSIDEENSKMLGTKLTSIEQQMKMEKRERRKTQKFYQNMRDSNKGDKSVKGERNTIAQVAKDITEMTSRVRFLELCKTHLEMLLAELQGIDISYLYSIAVCPEGEPLHLRPRPDNPLLQFQTVRDVLSRCEIQALHAGTPEGLMAYLFASTALSDGYIHQFLFCYRYFAVPEEVLNFLIHRYISAARAGSTEANISRLQQRVLDMLHFWLEGYYSIDFENRPDLVQTLQNFVKEQVSLESDGGKSLTSLLSSCRLGKNLELSSDDSAEMEMHFWQREEPKKPAQREKVKEWESFKQLVRGKSNAKEKASRVTISAVVVERRRRSAQLNEIDISTVSRRNDTFTLADYTPQNLAEQLTLIEQGIFQQIHPVHFLDSKSRGICVAMTMTGLRTPSVARRTLGMPGDLDLHTTGLFIKPLGDYSAIQKMIDHSQELTHWVAGEIVACSNPKSQVALLTKFLNCARVCMELHNFATSMSILDGLETLVVKQLPAWKNLSTKCIAIMEELDSCRMFLKNDPMSLMQSDKNCHLYPTIPSVVLFLLHVQQLEIGGFQFANKMYKWGKIRSICQVIDQIRIFREHMYGFQPEQNFQDTLRQRIHEFNTQDILTLASQHDINYQKISSGTGISGAFRKMKGKFQSK